MSIPYTYTAFTALSDNGNTAAVDLKGSVNDITVYFGAGVTFGSGTLTGMISYDGGTTYVACADAIAITSATANTVKATYRVYGQGKFRFTLSGSTTPTINVAVKCEQVEYSLPTRIAFAANGSSDAFMCDGTKLLWTAQGTWSSGTLVLESSPDGGTTWYKVAAGITANGVQLASSLTDTMYRLTLSGATTPVLVAHAFPSKL